jgi:hypothetical protein
MPAIVKNLGAALQLPDTLPYAFVGRKEHAAQYALLGFR